MSEYGKLNGVPIDPGDGWEIVQWHDIIARGAECTHDGTTWFDAVNCIGWAPVEMKDNFSHILAFRRPKQTVQAGQGESDPTSFPNIGPDPLKGDGDRSPKAAGDRLSKIYSVQQKEVPDQTCLVWRFDVSQVHGDLIWRTAAMDAWKKEAESLRTLTAAQSGALEKAREALICIGSEAHCEIKRRQAITLIQQAGEVGK